MAKLIDTDIEAARMSGQRHRDREHSFFPFRMENRLVAFDGYRAETVHPAHIVHAIHFVSRAKIIVNRERIRQARSRRFLSEWMN
jgi:hypothetical protein